MKERKKSFDFGGIDLYNGLDDLELYVDSYSGIDERCNINQLIQEEAAEAIQKTQPAPENTPLLTNSPQNIQSPAILKQSESPKLSMHIIADKVRQKIRVCVIESILFYFDGQIYRRLVLKKFAALLQDILEINQLQRLRWADIKDAYEYLSANPEIVLEECPDYGFLFACENGAFDLRTDERYDLSPKFFLFNIVHASYLPNIKYQTPAFNQLIENASGGDWQVKRLILAFLAYCMLPTLQGKVFFVLGTASNTGKSVLAKFLKQLFGKESVCHITLDDFGKEFGMSTLVGKSLNLLMDLPNVPISPMAVSKIKMLTGDDGVTVNIKYQDLFEYQNRATLVFGTNHPIQLREDDSAFWERMIIVPFENSIPPNCATSNSLKSFLRNETALWQR